jgi:ABC-type nickel/cobalt efflux system permease component RcnA
VDYVNLIVSEVPETFNQLVLAGIIKHGIAITVLIVVALAIQYALSRIAKVTKPQNYMDDNSPYILSYAGMAISWIVAAIAIPINAYYLVELLAAPRAYFMSYFF